MSWMLPLDAAIILFRICAMVMDTSVGCQLKCPSLAAKSRAHWARSAACSGAESAGSAASTVPGRVARVVDGGHVRAEVGNVQRRQAVLPVAEEVARPRWRRSASAI